MTPLDIRTTVDSALNSQSRNDLGSLRLRTLDAREHVTPRPAAHHRPLLPKCGCPHLTFRIPLDVTEIPALAVSRGASTTATTPSSGKILPQARIRNSSVHNTTRFKLSPAGASLEYLPQDTIL